MARKYLENKQHTFLVWLSKEGFTPEIYKGWLNRQCKNVVQRLDLPNIRDKWSSTIEFHTKLLESSLMLMHESPKPKYEINCLEIAALQNQCLLLLLIY